MGSSGDYNTNIEGGELERPQWLSGHFLISEANLADPNFHRTVVLLVTHDEHGAFGLILNRRLDVALEDVLPEFQGEEAGALPLYVGGPVEQQYLFTIHSGLPGTAKSGHSTTLVEHVTFEPQFDALSNYLLEEWSELPTDVRPPVNFYAGYSGWSAGQLESELERGSWVVRPAAAKHIFHPDPDRGWNDALGELGGYYKFIADTDFKPSMN